MSYVDISSNMQVFVQDWGSGRPFVFIPGWPFDNRCYEYQFNEIPQQGYRCIGIDMRGFGLSDRPWKDINYDIFAEDIHKVLKALDLKDVILIGHSMGGAIALHYMACYGEERISALALLAAAAPIWTQRPDYPYGFSKDEVNKLLALCYSDRPQLIEKFGKLFFLKENAVSPKFADWFQSLGMAASGHATAKCLEALRDTDLRSELSKITVPTLILHSPHDRVCPFDLANELKKGIKNSTLIEFENSGHGLFYEERDKCNQELIAFAERHAHLRHAA
jgi:non-heme chloroperoxidase